VSETDRQTRDELIERAASTFTAAGGERDGRSNWRLGLDEHQPWAKRGLAAKSDHDPAHNGYVALPDLDGVGEGPDILLQRCLRPDARREASIGARPAS
jgi:hypothetical protein